VAKRKSDKQLAQNYRDKAEKLRAKRDLDRELAKNKAIKKNKKELLAVHDAAKINRTTRDWPWTSVSSRTEITEDLPVITARVRQTVRDFWAAASAADGRGRHAVGTGLKPRGVARNPKTGEPLIDFNKRKDQLFRRWATKKEHVDYEQKKNFVACQRVGDREAFIVGNAFVIIHVENRLGNIPGLSLQMLEVEQLDNSITSYKGNAVVNGIEVNSKNVAVAYHFYTEGTDNYFTNSIRVLADRVIHYFRHDRVRQLLGISQLVASMVKGRHLTMLDAYELLAARMEATMTATLTYDMEYDLGDLDGLGCKKAADDNGVTPLGDTETIMEPARVIKLPQGQTLDFHDPVRPNKDIVAYMDQQISEYAAGIGLDFSLIKRDYSKGNFSSQRQALIELNKSIDAIQQDFIENFLQPIRDAFTDVCILQGLLDAPGYMSDPEWKEAYLEDKWIKPARPWIDPAKAAAANIIELETGSTTLSEIAESQGKDWRELLDQRAAEQEYAESKGLVLPWIATVGNSTPEQEKEREEFRAANRANILKLSAENPA